jgi:hypothetical protein
VPNGLLVWCCRLRSAFICDCRRVLLLACDGTPFRTLLQSPCIPITTHYTLSPSAIKQKHAPAACFIRAAGLPLPAPETGPGACCVRPSSRLPAFTQMHTRAQPPSLNPLSLVVAADRPANACTDGAAAKPDYTLVLRLLAPSHLFFWVLFFLGCSVGLPAALMSGTKIQQATHAPFLHSNKPVG